MQQLARKQRGKHSTCTQQQSRTCVCRTHRDAVRVGLVGQGTRSDERASAVDVRRCVVVPRVQPANRPSVRSCFLAHGARPRRHEVHRHESLGAGRHGPQLRLGTDERHLDRGCSLDYGRLPTKNDVCLMACCGKLRSWRGSLVFSISTSKSRSPPASV